MTVKQANLIKNLRTSKSLKEAAEKAGYSYTAKNLYRKTLKNTIAKALHSDPEAIKDRFLNIADRAKAKDDLSNEARAIEDLARINAMFTDRSQIEGIPASEIRIVYATKIVSLNDNVSKELEDKTVKS